METLDRLPPAATPGTGPTVPAGLSPRLRSWLAAAVVAQPLMLALNSTFHPDIELTGAGFLAGADAGPARWFLVHVVAALGAALAIPAGVGLRQLLPREAGTAARRVSAAGLALAVVGGVTLALAFAAEASVLRTAAEADVDAGAALAFAETYVAAPEALLVPIGGGALTLGLVLVVGALVPSRPVPRWVPVAYGLGMVAAAAAVPGTFVGPVAFGVVAFAGAVMARRLRTTAG